ncbi:unnamed protein product [Cuscuta campestris]|uniref:Uncharacterized protein n=1 Tax=Cuscuta campestris TaxID=132261 RepID=A0A484LP53_9ASTE|nr:unnamed protein product [Cuscuta campestris]
MVEYELQGKCYRRQLFLHPKVVNGQKVSISVDSLPCFKDLVIVVASCHNLVLCSESYDDEYDDGVYYLCNPYTKQWIQLPPAPSKGQAVLGMICDHPIVCNNDDDVPKGLGGVGLKPRHFGSEALFRDQLAHHRFRVVRVPLPVFANDDGEGGFQVEMLSCGGGGDSGGWEWRTLPVVLPPLRRRPFIWKEHRIWVRRHGVACNGLLHWLLGSSAQLLVYDPYTNVVKATVETPLEAAPIFPLKLLGPSCGSLYGQPNTCRISTLHTTGSFGNSVRIMMAGS